MNTVNEKKSLNLWKLQQLSLANELLYFELEALWEYFLLSTAGPNFGSLYCQFGRSLHLIENLERHPFVKNTERVQFENCLAYFLQNESVHDTVYDVHKDFLVEQAANTLVAGINLLRNFDEHYGSMLMQDLDPDGDEDHPLLNLLQDRDEIAYTVLGLRILQTREQYLSLDLDRADRDLKVCELTLRKAIIRSAKHINHIDTVPYSPPDFWWRRIPRHS